MLILDIFFGAIGLFALLLFAISVWIRLNKNPPDGDKTITMDYQRVKRIDVSANGNFATKKDNPFVIKVTYTDSTVVEKVCGKKQAKNNIKKYKKECPETVIFDTEVLN